MKSFECIQSENAAMRLLHCSSCKSSQATERPVSMYVCVTAARPSAACAAYCDVTLGHSYRLTNTHLLYK